MKRKEVSKRIRFEIFKRDNFQCMYCGRTPPFVVLHVDHVLPVVEGGDNDCANLVTACEDCNQGKGGHVVSTKQLQRTVTEERKRQQEKALQAAAYADWRKAEIVKEEAVFERLCDEAATALWGETYAFGKEPRASVRRFLRHLAPADILQAAQIARDGCKREDVSSQLRYFYKVCWNKIKGIVPGSQP